LVQVIVSIRVIVVGLGGGVQRVALLDDRSIDDDDDGGGV